MHKSGTSLVAELLHAAGVAMVEDVASGDYDAGNKWERAATVELDKRFLDATGVHSLDLAPPPAGRAVDEDLCAEARALVASLAGSDWGFKDPRACFAWPLWEAALADAQVVGVYRHFGQVARHYVRHAAADQRGGPFWPQRVARLAVLRWIQHNRAVLEAVRASGRRGLLLSYERLMEGPTELLRLARFLGRPVPDLRDPRKHRQRRPPDRRARVAASLLRLSGRGDATATWAALEAERARQVEAEPAPAGSP